MRVCVALMEPRPWKNLGVCMQYFPHRLQKLIADTVMRWVDQQPTAVDCSKCSLIYTMYSMWVSTEMRTSSTPSTWAYSVGIHGGSEARSGIGEPFKYSWISDCDVALKRNKSSRLNRSKLICERWLTFVRLPAAESLRYGDVFNLLLASVCTSKLSRLFWRWCFMFDFIGFGGRSIEFGVVSTMLTLPTGGCFERSSVWSLCRRMAAVRFCCGGSRPSFTGGSSYSPSSFSMPSYDSKLILGRLPGRFNFTAEMPTLLSAVFPLNVS